MTRPELDKELDDIQDILVGYSASSYPYARYLFVSFDDGLRGREWLGGVASEVTTAGQRVLGSALNVGLTWPGLRVLGVSEGTLRTFPKEFQVGMAARADQLHDSGADSPEHWEPNGPGTTRIDAVVVIHADAEHRDQRCQWVRDSLVGIGRVVSQQDGSRLLVPGSKSLTREHFGFVDGVSQPVIEGLKRRNNGTQLLPGQGVRNSDGTWRPLRTGEIILGYRDEENLPAPGPTPAELARNGSYLVYRKLRQDVAAFRRLIAQQGQHYPEGPEMLAAKIVGRTTDGTPLALGDGSEPTTVKAPFGAFTYQGDLEGRRCPIGAHIRRANPRDGFSPAHHKLVHRHRMLRRGISYGSPLPDDVLADDGKERGLLFVCLCASIARQFEFVQGQWLSDGNSLGLGDDRDPLLGTGGTESNLTIPGAQPRFVSHIPRLVTVQGGEYFFLPGQRALSYLATLGH